MLGVQLHCSLNESLYIFNIYRHPNTNTPFFFYRKLFDFASTNKYVLFVSDFNAHHPDWHDSKTDSQRENISSVRYLPSCYIERWLYNFLSSPNSSSSIIDLSISSRPLASLVDTSTIQDLHFSIRVTVTPILLTFGFLIDIISLLLNFLYCKPD